jgi:L-aminopeptidase/D-esterase-like protein
MPGPRNSLTDVAGLLVGHHHELHPGATMGSGAATGCTVVRALGGAVAAVDVRGGGPGTRETDLLDPSHSVQQVNSILLTGGSAYGLAAADGVMRWLEEHGHGIAMGTPDQVVPIVPAAVIFDLPVGDWSARPTAEFGYAAAAAASVEFATGSVGAGVGARAGVLKGGVGTASTVIDGGPADGVTVGALIVTNPVGAVFDPRTGLLWGTGSRGPQAFGLRTPDVHELWNANALSPKGTALNTTIGVVATDVDLTASSCKRIAVAGHDGLARAIRPSHSPLDGDTIFALSTGTRSVVTETSMPKAFTRDLPVLDAVSAVAADVVERAIVAALLDATSLAGIPTYRQIFPSAFES